MKKILLIAMLNFTATAYGQTWYFGNGGGIKFNTPLPSTSPAPGLPSPINTSEGSAVLVDKNNIVVMYTNGTQIWNGSHLPQITSPPLLKGNTSSTQTALIVPVTGTNGSKAFIFTVDAAENSYGNINNGPNINNAANAGLRVSLANISGNPPNTVITINPFDINVRLTPGNTTMSEKLAVTSDGNGGFWVLTHGVGIYPSNPTNGVVNGWFTNDENVFYAYKVSSATTTISALSATETMSVTNNATIYPHRSWDHPQGGGFSFDPTFPQQFNGQGQLKINSCGTKIACTLPWYGNSVTTSGWRVKPVGQLFDFNKSTGAVSNGIQFNLGFNFTTAKDGSAMGVEFSPNGQYLYISSTLGSSALQTITSRIYRYTVSSNPLTITNSKALMFALPASNQAGFSVMQIGPNNKIYIARPSRPFLDVLNDPDNPNASVSAGYFSGVPISGTCISGLPTTVLISNAILTPTLSVPAIICGGTPITATGNYTGAPAPASYYWEIFGSDANGTPVNSTGGPVANTYLSWYNFNQTFTGTPGAFTFPNSNSIQCNKYYTVKLVLLDACGNWYQGSVQQTIFVQCKPTPLITSDTPNPVCYGASINLCVNYTPSNSVVIHWANNTYSYPNSNQSCILTKPLQILTYTVTVTEGSCTGTATYTAIPETNNPDFSLNGYLPSTSSLFYNISATPIVPPINTGYWWHIVEIDQNGLNVPNTEVINPNCWWINPNTNQFKGYNYTTLYTSTPNNNSGTGYICTPTFGQFRVGSTYKVTRGTWTSVCPWQAISATIKFTRSANNSSGFVIEKSETTYANSKEEGIMSIINNKK